jgi:3-keto-L-gulonate-6-phosphate decarboxylase
VHRLRDRDEEMRTDPLSFTEAASNLSGTFTVTGGVHTANIELLINDTAGQFAAGLPA